MENKKETFVSLCSDTTFKYLLKKEETRNWIFEIIKSKTNIDLNEFKMIDNELNTGNGIKDYRMDLVFEKDNLIVILEMNNQRTESSNIKSYQYLYKIESSRFMVGEEYTEKRTILILFNNFKNPKSPNLLDAHFTFNDQENQLLIEDIESYEFYLPNYKRTCYDRYDEIGRRLVLFTAKSFEEIESITQNSFDLEIIKELRNLSMDGIFLTAYEKEKVQQKLVNSAYKEGLNKGIEKGMEQGNKESKIEIAKSMLAEDESLEKISRYTGLSIEDIQNI